MAQLSIKSVVGIALVSVGILTVALLTPSPAPAEPAISWTPGSITARVPAGQSKTITASFIASKNASSVTVRVVPELAAFVHVAPVSFENLTVGEPTEVRVTFSVPTTSSPLVLKGTIQVRAAANPNHALARPLPVALSVVWPEVLSEALGIQVSYPPFLTVSEVTTNRLLFAPAGSINPGADAIAPIGLFVLPQTLESAVDELRNRITDGLVVEDVLIDGKPGKRIVGVLDENVFGWGGSRHIYVLVESSGRLYQFDADGEDRATEQTFNEILSRVLLQ